MQTANRYKILIHVAGWSVFFIIPLLFSPTHEFSANLTSANLISMFIRNLLWMALFYVNLFYITPVVFKKRGLLSFLVSLGFVVIVVTLINSRVHHFFSSMLHETMPPRSGPPMPFGDGPPPPRPLDFNFRGPFFFGILISFMVASVSTTLAFGTEWAKAQVSDQERTLQKVASELAILKLQISPHFLFNTLNNIRWLIRSRSDQAEEAVVRLSQLLRYILYQTDAEKVPLAGEMAHVFDYIALQRLRLSDDQSFVFSGMGDARDKMIIPLLFIPIVENVFKYGDFQSGYQNHIHMEVQGDRLVVKTENKILPRPSPADPEQSGIGLSNVKKRLSLHYPGRHLLQHSEENGIFRLELEILL